MKKLLDDCGPCATGQLHYFSWENFGFFLFFFVFFLHISEEDLRRLKRSTKKAPKLLFPKDLVLVAAKNCVK
jgi:hypothetical protein